VQPLQQLLARGRRTHRQLQQARLLPLLLLLRRRMLLLALLSCGRLCGLKLRGGGQGVRV
jgi:hypothetical protein